MPPFNFLNTDPYIGGSRGVPMGPKSGFGGPKHGLPPLSKRTRHILLFKTEIGNKFWNVAK